MGNEREFISPEEAEKMLPDGNYIHTFKQALSGGGFAATLIGADYKREDIIERIKNMGAELSGPAATRMNHGLASVNPRDPRDTIFIETKPEGGE